MAGAAVLRIGIDADRTDARNRRALVHEVTACDASVQLAHYSVEARRGDHAADDAESSVQVGELVRKPMLVGELAERAITNLAADLDVLARRASYLCFRFSHIMPRPWSRGASRRGDGRLPAAPAPKLRRSGRGAFRCSR